MPIRVSGMNSGLDTEAIITQLTSGLKTKRDNEEKAKTKLEWKMEAWSDLNKKVKKLYTEAGNMRFSTAYAKKKTTVSDSSKATITASDNAVNGSQTLKIKSMAKSGYLTGAELASTTTGSTKLSDLGITSDGTFKLKIGAEEKEISYSSSDTMDSLAKKFTDAGVKANFDTDTKRFFVSSTASGAKYDFTLSGTSGSSNAALSALGLQAGGTIEKSMYTAKAAEGIYNAGVLDYAATQSYFESRATAARDAAKALTDAQVSLAAKQDRLKELEEQEKDDTLTDEDKASIATEKASLESEISTLTSDVSTKTDALNSYTEFKDVKNLSSFTNDQVKDLAKAYTDDIKYADDVVNDRITTVAGNATKLKGEDAEIELNGAKFTSNSNTFSVNGLTIQVTGVTGDNELSINTDTDVSGIYDSVKSFLKQYNEIINEMTKLYNADAAKGYDALTDEEKADMSDNEVEKWEEKVKSAMFRRDSNMGGLISSMTTAMMKTYDVNGKTMALSSLGIHTLGYLNADTNEQYAYHIDGDGDDSSTGGNADKLKAAIAKNPNEVTGLLTQVFKGLYNELDKKMQSTELRSRYSIYNDKEMKTQNTKYESLISDWEEKITDEEDKYYNQFAAMEKALAQLQSNSSSLTGMLG